MRGWLGCLFAASLVAGSSPAAFSQGIFTCVDAKGRHLTSDRPIIDCIDRDQNEITPNGQVIRKIKPSLTADEIAAEEEKQRRAADARNRQLEEKRRDAALLTRYPDKATHDKERQAALVSIDEAIKAAQHRIVELQADRKKLDSELEFYKGDMAKAPPALKHRFEENEQSIAAQERFIATRQDEKGRVNARYDDELARLKSLWMAKPTSATPSAARR